MSLLDINEHYVGTVSRVLLSSFVASVEGELVELDRGVLFSVDEFGAKLVCEREAIGRYRAFRV